jgi:hypothetical protein
MWELRITGQSPWDLIKSDWIWRVIIKLDLRGASCENSGPVLSRVPLTISGFGLRSQTLTGLLDDAHVLHLYSSSYVPPTNTPHARRGCFVFPRCASQQDSSPYSAHAVQRHEAQCNLSGIRGITGRFGNRVMVFSYSDSLFSFLKIYYISYYYISIISSHAIFIFNYLFAWLIKN